MIAAMAKGAQVLDRPDYAEAAQQAARFILARMRDDRGRLLHRYREGEAAVQGILDDYAFLVWGLLELYETVFEADFLKIALELADITIDHFLDEKEGGFFFTADDGEEILFRHKDSYDGAIPSGNSVMMLNLLRLSRITGRSDLEEKALGVSRAFARNIGQIPSAYSQLMVALEFLEGPSMRSSLPASRAPRTRNRCWMPYGTLFCRTGSCCSGRRGRRAGPLRNWLPILRT